MNQSNLDFRQNRRGSGKCIVCVQDSLPNRNVCRKHYIVDVANFCLGKADTRTVDSLINKLDKTPYCPYTGETLVIGLNTHLDHILSKKNHPELKSDLSNVEWISEKANLAKGAMNRDEFIQFCKIVCSRF